MIRSAAVVAVCTLGLAQVASAGFLIEIDTDGMDDGVLTLNPNFSFGLDTSIASQSITSTAFGTTGGDSIFGGDGVQFLDTYSYAYSPDAMSDNLAINAGQDLGDGNVATGATGGAPGLYNVYATWNLSDNVSGGDTRFTVINGAENFMIDIDQNGRGNAWYLLGTINYTSGEILVVQQPTGGNTFVSMRAHGVLFEAVVPAPGAAGLLGFGALLAGTRRRR